MFAQRDAWWWHRSNSALREIIARGYLSKIFSPLIVTEYPKSGGTWLSQMLSEVTGLPYPRGRYPILKDSILHGCWLQPNDKFKTVVLMRDGRDVMVSYYYHIVYPKKETSEKFNSKICNRIGIEDPREIKKYMCVFIDWAYTEGFPGWSWSDFVDTWANGENKAVTSYESLKADCEGELTKLLTTLEFEYDSVKLGFAVDKYSFERQSGRTPGQEDVNSFVRKGVVGDWKNHFDSDSAKLFNELAGNQLVVAGYEQDDSWVRTVS